MIQILKVFRALTVSTVVMLLVANLYLVKINVISRKGLALCPAIPPELKGFQKPTTQVGAWAFLEELNPDVMPGGMFKPSHCQSRHRVAIVIPFRDREIHLKIFLRNMHPFLQRQQLDYGIFVIEMAQNITFNRALLINVGFVEALKRYNYECFIFHDVDLLPEDDRNLYTCPTSPRHMSVAIDIMQYELPYPEIFGGVCAISTQDFKTINGFSNLYFGWGAEDDDMYRRDALLSGAEARQRTDGLNSLAYQMIKSELRPLYTWILIAVNETQILENEPMHKVAFRNLHKKTPPQKAVNLQQQSKQIPNGFNINSSLSNVYNSSKDNSKQKDANVSVAKQYAIVRELIRRKFPKFVSWVPEKYKGEIPAHLNTLQALPKPAILKPGKQNTGNKQVANRKDLSVQGRVKAQQTEKSAKDTRL